LVYSSWNTFFTIYRSSERTNKAGGVAASIGGHVFARWARECCQGLRAPGWQKTLHRYLFFFRPEGGRNSPDCRNSSALRAEKKGGCVPSIQAADGMAAAIGSHVFACGSQFPSRQRNSMLANGRGHDSSKRPKGPSGCSHGWSERPQGPSETRGVEVRILSVFCPAGAEEANDSQNAFLRPFGAGENAKPVHGFRCGRRSDLASPVATFPRPAGAAVSCGSQIPRDKKCHARPPGGKKGGACL
jgi:hypothetical protein